MFTLESENTNKADLWTAAIHLSTIDFPRRCHVYGPHPKKTMRLSVVKLTGQMDVNKMEGQTYSTFVLHSYIYTGILVIIFR